NASPDTSKNKISKNNQSTRREYILNLTPHGKLSTPGQSAGSSLSLSIFPNPASEKITLSFSDEAFISTIRITDIMGKVLQEMSVNLTDRTISIDVSGFENGTYIVNASTSS